MQRTKHTRLHIAAEKGHRIVVFILIKSGASVNAIDSEKRTPLHIAAKEGYPAVVKILIKSGASVNATDIDDCTPLHLATDGEVCRILLEKGKAKIEAADLYLCTPLHYAVYRAQEAQEKKEEETWMKKIIYLLEKGASVNSQDINGNTPCHVAVDHKRFYLLKILLPHMKENLCNGHNQTVFDSISQYYAALKDSKEFSWLRSMCTEKNPCNGHNQSVFDLISQYDAALKDSKEFSYLWRRCTKKNPCKGHSQTDFSLNKRHYVKPNDFDDLHELLKEFKVLKAPPVKLDKLPKSRNLEIKDSLLGPNIFELDDSLKEGLTAQAEAKIIVEKLEETKVSKKEYLEDLLKRFAHPRSYWTTSGQPGYDLAVRVEKFVRDFLGRAAEIDPRFTGTLELVGSCGDGARLGEPEEFDFLLTIQDLSDEKKKKNEEILELSTYGIKEGRVQVRLTGKDIQNPWEPFLNHDHQLDSKSVFSYFYYLLRETSRRLESLTKFGFSFRKASNPGQRCYFTRHTVPLVRPMKTGCTLQLHCLETGLWIDVDVGLGIKFPGWPDRGHHVLPFDELRKVFPPSVKDEEVCYYYIVPASEIFVRWQLSFVTLEKVILSHIDERLLNVLKILKTLNALLKAKNDESGWPSDYVMKTAFLHYLASTKLVSGDNFSLTETVVEILKNFCGNGFQSPIYSFFLPKREVWIPMYDDHVVTEFERLIHNLESTSPPTETNPKRKQKVLFVLRDRTTT